MYNSKKIVITFGLMFALGACQTQAPPPTTGAKLKSKAEPSKKTSPQETAKSNPFFTPYNTPFSVPPFDRIKTEHFLPALKRRIAEHKKEVAAIVNNSAPPTFANTLEALDLSGEMLWRVVLVFFGYLGSNTSDELQAVAGEWIPLLTKHRDDIHFDQKLFQRIKAIYDKRASLELDPEKAYFLEETYQRFIRAGANLDDKKRARLRDINKQLALLYLKFRDNILEETNRFTMVLEKKADLAGLPPAVVSAAAETAKERGKAGKWIFTIHKPSLIPFLRYSKKRELREKMFKAYITQGDHNDELDNKKTVARIAKLRVEKANLLGYKTYAAFSLTRNMARTPAEVSSFLKKLWKPARSRAKKEARALQRLIRKDGKGLKLKPWDWWYYAEKLRKARYDLDETELRPYFKLENVRKGAFDLATRLFGLRFKERNDLPRYHPDVKIFEVLEADGKHVALLYVDYFPRASKRGGAWCTEFRSQRKRGGKRIAPIVINVGNFSKPTADKPALLSFEEVETLFHEFGHALHSMLAETTYLGDLGDNIPIDFIEFPSQIMENWASDPEYLKMYARHYKTGASVPDELIRKINKSRHFNKGFETLEYLAASLLDMDWHMMTEAKEVDPAAFEARSLKKMGMIPEIVVRYRSPYFSHIFSGDHYAAGYYSYIWSAVLDADAFEAFKKTGLFDKKIAQSYRKNILARAGAEDPMKLYIRFRGAKPNIQALLKRNGLK